MNDRHKHIGKAVCLIRNVEQFLVEKVEPFKRFFFVAENFNDFLPVHHLLDIPLDFTDGTLLRHKVFRAFSADFLRQEKYRDYADHNYHPKNNTVIKHYERQRNECYRRHAKLR